MKLSIVIPVYNTAEYLPQCLETIACGGDRSASQDKKGASAASAAPASPAAPAVDDFEIVAVNDGSTDNSGEILKTWQKKYPNVIRVIETPNGGLGHARNTGLEAAQGDYVLFVDSDDALAPGAVNEMLTCLAQNESVDIVVFDFEHVDEQGNRLRYCAGCDTDEGFAYAERPDFLFAPHNAVNKLWRTKLFLESGIRFPDRMWFEDLATVPKLYLEAERILPVHRCWYRYLQRDGSIMLQHQNAGRNLEMTQVAAGVQDWYRARGKEKQFHEALEYKFWYEEYLASVTRVNQIDPQSPVQAALRDDYVRHFPGYRDNPRVRQASAQLKLLDNMIRRGNWRAVSVMIRLNNLSKGRGTP